MPEATDKPADDTTGSGAAAPEGEKPKSEATKTFTQEELDAIVQDRLKRAVPKDYEELKAKAAKVDEAEEAAKTDLQKEKEARLESERAAKERNSKADAKLRRAAILSEAATQGTSDADIVVALLMNSADITVDDDGEVSGVKEAVRKLLKDKPVLVKGTNASASGGEFGGKDQETLAERIKAAEAKGDWKLSRQLKLAQVVQQ